jgi:hypothetical protein
LRDWLCDSLVPMARRDNRDRGHGHTGGAKCPARRQRRGGTHCRRRGPRARSSLRALQCQPGGFGSGPRRPHSPSLSGLPGRPSQSRRSAGGCLHNHGGCGRCASGTQWIERARRPLAAIWLWRCHSLGDPEIQAYMTICRL